jgi:L-histidine Nalpha-methyltransferase
MLDASGRKLTAALTNLRAQGLWGRYQAGLAWLRDSERDALLSEIAGTLRAGDHFLVSVDLQKPAQVFDACYNDPLDRSAFARFRLNHLAHLNRRFGGNFIVEYFYPRAQYDSATTTVESHLYATENQFVALRELDLSWNCAAMIR